MHRITQEEVARRALEVACSRADMETAKELYSSEFVDHVNGEVFRGHEGIRHSVTLYQRLFRDFSIRVDDQVSEGDKVVSRFTMFGSRAGRRVSVTGIVVSRFEDGKIVEDWSVTDSSSLIRQLGLRGTIAVAFTWLRSRS
jgi:predicted ester cyclase